MPSASEMELKRLKELTGRVGSDPLLTQASTGNSSAKLDGKLWIKASGRWMADALRDDIFIALDHGHVVDCLEHGRDPSETFQRASLETAMHAALPQRFVLHVHSVDAIAWAVRQDAVAQLEPRLDGLCWRWIPYAASGLPLANAIREEVSRDNNANVFVLANHGLVVAADEVSELWKLLRDVSRRLAIRARTTHPADYAVLARMCEDSVWEIPDDDDVHALGTDSVCRKILSGGLLYPCQAMLRGAADGLFQPVASAGAKCADRPFLIVDRFGVLINRSVRPAELAMLSGAAQVLRRLSAPAPIRYLTADEIAGISCPVAQRYMEFANASYESVGA